MCVTMFSMCYRVYGAKNDRTTAERRKRCPHGDAADQGAIKVGNYSCYVCYNVLYVLQSVRIEK